MVAGSSSFPVIVAPRPVRDVAPEGMAGRCTDPAAGDGVTAPHRLLAALVCGVDLIGSELRIHAILIYEDMSLTIN
jgi:hypothetical protein